MIRTLVTIFVESWVHCRALAAHRPSVRGRVTIFVESRVHCLPFGPVASLESRVHCRLLGDDSVCARAGHDLLES